MLTDNFYIIGQCFSHITTPAGEQQNDKTYINHIVVNELITSSKSIQQALNTLNESNTARYGNSTIPFANVKDPDLSKTISLSYYGPLENVLTQIANIVHYKVQIFGKEPPFSVVVIIGKLNLPQQDSALNLLRDIAVQTGKQASITINTQAKVISLRYAQLWS